MRILQISSLYGVEGGGAGLLVYYLTHGLQTLGHRVSIITLGGDYHPSFTDEQGIRVYRFRPRNIYRFEAKSTLPFWKRMIWQLMDVYNLHGAGVLRQIIEEESPDIIHIHKMRGFSGAVWLVPSRLFPGHVIQTCHDYESMSPDGLMRGVIGRMALNKNWPIRGYQIIRAKLSAGVSVVTAPSSFTLDRIVACGLFPHAHSRVVSNTHGWSSSQLEFIHQEAGNFSANEIRFLFLGRLEREKGIVELCEAFLQALVLHPSLQLDIAGWGMLDSELRKKYAACSNINFLGRVDGEKREHSLSRAAVVVVPSLVEEVFGLVTVEAFAFGKPVIASNIGGLPELVKHGETGWLVEPGDIGALAEQLQSVAKMDSLSLVRMSETCKEYSYDFSMEKILAEYLELYRQLAK